MSLKTIRQLEAQVERLQGIIEKQTQVSIEDRELINKQANMLANNDSLIARLNKDNKTLRSALLDLKNTIQSVLGRKPRKRNY